MHLVLLVGAVHVVMMGGGCRTFGELVHFVVMGVVHVVWMGGGCGTNGKLVQGLKEGRELPPPSNFDPGQLTASEREERGIQDLPSSLGAALDALEKDTGGGTNLPWGFEPVTFGL
jgi:hypothetical protein